MFKQHMIVIIFTAFLMQAFIPAGYMPSYDHGKGQITIEICTANGMETVTIDGEPHDHTPVQEEMQTTSECLYAFAMLAFEYGTGAYMRARIPLPQNIFAHERLIKKTPLHINAERAPPYFV